jgi:hypothetical protein
VVLVEMQQEKLPSMYSQVMKAAQDRSGLVIDEVTVKINREEEEETYGRGKEVHLSQIYVIPRSWKCRECSYRFSLLKRLSLKIKERNNMLRK